MGKSIRIDSQGRIETKNFNSVLQLRRFSYMHHCAARLRHGSFASMSLRDSTKAISSSVCCNVGQPSVDWSSSFRTRVQSLDSRTSGVDCGGGSDIAHCPRSQRGSTHRPRIQLWDESNWIESNWLVCGAELNGIGLFSFLPNRPSLNWMLLMAVKVVMCKIFADMMFIRDSCAYNDCSELTCCACRLRTRNPDWISANQTTIHRLLCLFCLSSVHVH